MHVLIPAGGRGTRLRPLTDEHPKPLLPLGDRPILSRIVDGIPEDVPITVIVTSQVAAQFEAWRHECHPARRLTLFVEDNASGPAGPVTALGQCSEHLGLEDDVLVMMGDSVHPFRWDEFVNSVTPGQAQIAAFELPDRRDARRFGVVEFEGGLLTGFEEKPEEPKSSWIFTGCFYLPRCLVERLPEMAKRNLPQMGQLVATCLQDGNQIRVFQLAGEWHDIGTFESYLVAHRSEMSRGEMERLRALGNRLEGVIYVHPSARVFGSRLRNCVVFGQTEIRDAELTDCVIRSNTVISNRVIRSKLISSMGEQSVVHGEVH